MEQHQDVGTSTSSTDQFVVGFYDDLAKDYQLIFGDWKQSVRRQAEIVSDLLEKNLSKSTQQKEKGELRVLDCTCGIGTQAIGLALKGYHVVATDISSESVKKASEEALGFGVVEKMEFDVVNLLQLSSWRPDERFEVVMAMNNALAHLQKEEELRAAFENMAAKLSPGGLFMTSFRDYDAILKERPRSTLPTVIDSESPDGNKTRTVSFQVWDWVEESYEMSHYTLRQHQTSCETVCRKSRMRAWQREKITSFMEEDGKFTDIKWLMPSVSGFYQPIVVAHKK